MAILDFIKPDKVIMLDSSANKGFAHSSRGMELR